MLLDFCFPLSSLAPVRQKVDFDITERENIIYFVRIFLRYKSLTLPRPARDPPTRLITQPGRGEVMGLKVMTIINTGPNTQGIS